ncbi:MAG TPA: nucleotidyltransferase domain-containing protein [Spirochaetia bacterium]|nr:nucleotidyltransferase domain-containing protein [Spirochaetia bacterium]
MCADSTPELLAVGYIGSYARGDWGVGSDVDVVLVLEKSDVPFERRALAFDTMELPVPADMLVYTRKEFTDLLARGGRFAATIRREIAWAWQRAGSPGLSG